jgi:hypothetical protein
VEKEQYTGDKFLCGLSNFRMEGKALQMMKDQSTQQPQELSQCGRSDCNSVKSLPVKYLDDSI